MAMDDREGSGLATGDQGRAGDYQLLRRLYSEDRERGAKRLSADGPTMGAEANGT